jgi:hypothetical protein
MMETRHGGTSGPTDDEHLIVIERSQILFPGPKEGVSLAHMAQGPKWIPRLLNRWAADCRRFGRRGRCQKLNADKGKRRMLPTLQQWRGRLAMPDREQAIPTVTEVGCESPVVGAA